MKFEMRADYAAIDSIVTSYQATEKQVDLARNRALKKTRSWLTTQVKRAVAKELGITQKSITNRFYFEKIKPGSDEVKLWIGTNPVLPFAIGNPSLMGSPKKPTGIKVRGYRFPGAFIGRIYSKQKKVWIRLHSSHYSPELYPSSNRGSSGMGTFPGSKGRFPVVQAAIPIDEEVKEVLESLEDDLGNKYEENFSRELNYQVNVKRGGS